MQRIHDYGVIGDCRSMALVSRNGSIDWLCWPRFDSPSIFAAILDHERGGGWSMAPVGNFESRREYVRDSNVLKTEFLCATGRATLTDFMPVASESFKHEHLLPDHEIIRQVDCTEGEVQIDIDFTPRAFYGSMPVSIRDVSPLGLRMDVGRGTYWLRSSVPLEVKAGRAFATVTVTRGETLQFSFSYAEGPPAVLPALGARVERALNRSIQWWQDWAARAKYAGPYRESVVRSALLLKMLAYAPSGAIVAAPTTSLPERIGDTLNWDYRYCWLRDASLTVRALLGLGYMEEAKGFLSWLLHATRLTQPELKIMYNVFGRIAPREKDLEHLDGHFGSRPVRIGNGARHQLQLDVYGEVIDATAQYAQHVGWLDRTTQKVLVKLGAYIAKNWDQPDEGIWEPRSGRRNNTHSRLLCWTGLDRLLAMHEKRLVQGLPREWFSRERDRIKEQIQHRAWNTALQSYVSELDSDTFDATLLRLPWYGFEEAGSPRMQSTHRRVLERLGAGDGLLYRYERTPQEGAFGICGFWNVECVALSDGGLEQSQELFASLLTYGNDLGLFAEETDPASGDGLGNFPQAFTHVGLISAALTLEEQARGKAHPAVHTGEDVRAGTGKAA